MQGTPSFLPLVWSTERDEGSALILIMIQSQRAITKLSASALEVFLSSEEIGAFFNTPVLYILQPLYHAGSRQTLYSLLPSVGWLSVSLLPIAVSVLSPFAASSTKSVKSCRIMRLINLLLLATAVIASPNVDYSSPRTISALHTKLSGLDCQLGPQAVEKLKAVDTNTSSRSCVDAVSAFDHVVVGIVPHLLIKRCQCNVLNLILKTEVVDAKSQNFTNENNYWSNQQAETIPACRVKPRSSKEVAVTLLIVQFLHCQFAVKSGGHAMFKGASNIDSGITIDLKNLKQVAVSADRSFTKVGAGNHWADVYSRLDPLGLSVVGGRVADIGVGGLTLGGK